MTSVSAISTTSKTEALPVCPLKHISALTAETLPSVHAQFEALVRAGNLAAAFDLYETLKVDACEAFRRTSTHTATRLPRETKLLGLLDVRIIAATLNAMTEELGMDCSPTLLGKMKDVAVALGATYRSDPFYTPLQLPKRDFQASGANGDLRTLPNLFAYRGLVAGTAPAPAN